MSITAEERRAIVEFRIEKALRALEQAQGVIVLKYWETIANCEKALRRLIENGK